jgi:hypothetical protein
MVLFGNYYGGIVRKLFLGAAVLMLASLPFFQSLIPFPAWISILGVVILILGAGFLSRSEKWFIVADSVIAGLAVIIFEYYATNAYRSGLIAFFMANQILAIIFLVAFYYSLKTIRGLFMDSGTLE